MNLVRANSTKLPRYLWMDRIVHPVAIASESVNANSTKDIFLDKSIYFHHKLLLKNNFLIIIRCKTSLFTNNML
jgi:hypothetical protein